MAVAARHFGNSSSRELGQVTALFALGPERGVAEQMHAPVDLNSDTEEDEEEEEVPGELNGQEAFLVMVRRRLRMLLRLN